MRGPEEATESTSMSATGIPTVRPGHGLTLGIKFQERKVLTDQRLGTSLSLRRVASH